MYVHAEPSAARLLACPAKKQRAEPPSKLIPAGAGNTTFFSSWSGLGAVHPRWRGEHVEPWPMVGTSPGSSPLARGTLLHLRLLLQARRFIPAGAGNTRPAGPQRKTPAVHPRWRGEHSARVMNTPRNTGSSPLARGTPYLKHPEFLRQRFIPAGAGNTQAPSLSWRPAPVHPRWRGEHLSLNSQTANLYGSSPLARGTRARLFDGVGLGRFIPAGAGNTPE